MAKEQQRWMTRGVQICGFLDYRSQNSRSCSPKTQICASLLMANIEGAVNLLKLLVCSTAKELLKMLNEFWG